MQYVAVATAVVGAAGKAFGTAKQVQGANEEARLSREFSVYDADVLNLEAKRALEARIEEARIFKRHARRIEARNVAINSPLALMEENETNARHTQLKILNTGIAEKDSLKRESDLTILEGTINRKRAKTKARALTISGISEGLSDLSGLAGQFG